MILGLALIPSKTFREKIDAYRKRYDERYAQIPPHITIKDSFEVEEGDLDKVKEEIKSRIEGIEPLYIHATKASNFAPVNNVIYFKVEKTPELEELNDRFNNGDFHGQPEHSFVPHFTIAQGLTSQEFEDIFGQVKLAGIDYEETISALTLMKYDDEEEKWVEIDTFNFK
ncbi:MULTISPECIES: YjcG family protein [Staphylococcus]|uniref:YjcG family protein n=1 Tax=Staphylococcus TaxID=1279 RepID=UPI000D0437FE|nr:MULTISPECIES: YjcG family protein [Staphylococcus]MCD8914386.1 YjcG family protein [Staphylococcus simulans]UXV34381.1 YjcG family protein [Staphylococcus sp. IVB6181]